MIGTKIRESRKEAKLTLADLAQKTGFSASYISQVERNLVDPSITALRKFCTVLQRTVYYFLEEDPTDPYIVRKETRQRLNIPSSNVVYEFISPMLRQMNCVPKIEVIQVFIEPNSYSQEETFSHNVDEIILVLEGVMDIYIDGNKQTLYAGDSIYLPPNTLQRIFNPLDVQLVILSALTPGIF